MSSKMEWGTTGLLTIAALVIAASAARRTFFPASVTPAASRSAQPEFVSSWKEALPLGIRIGDSTAPVTIVEFADLECPACRAFHAALRDVLRSHPQEVSVVYVSYPLNMHRFALGAARGAECAYRDGRFREWVDLIYAKQDSLGLKSWGSYAQEAGLPDTAAISKCARDPAPVVRIEAGRAFGGKIHITGTPTVIVNGWRFPYVPNGDELTHVVERIASGEAPFETNADPSG